MKYEISVSFYPINIPVFSEKHVTCRIYDEVMCPKSFALDEFSM